MRQGRFSFDIRFEIISFDSFATWLFTSSNSFGGR
jgi:hypothetical protein